MQTFVVCMEYLFDDYYLVRRPRVPHTVPAFASAAFDVCRRIENRPTHGLLTPKRLCGQRAPRTCTVACILRSTRMEWHLFGRRTFRSVCTRKGREHSESERGSTGDAALA